MYIDCFIMVINNFTSIFYCSLIVYLYNEQESTKQWFRYNCHMILQKVFMQILIVIKHSSNVPILI